jgi:GNAT superfamily N-acetyltransferase
MTESTGKIHPQEGRPPSGYWTNRLARPDETDAVLALVRTVHGDAYPELNREYWQWRYLNEAGFRAEVIVADYEDKPIAILPMAVFDCQWGTHYLTGMMITGLLTHPDHRRRGIARSVNATVRQLAAERGACFIMGMPNEASLVGYRKFPNWVYPGIIPLYVKVISFPKFLAPKTGRVAAHLLGGLPQIIAVRGRRPIGGSPFKCQKVDRVPPELDGVSDQFARDCNTLMIRRTSAYWNWRYDDKPVTEYHSVLAWQDDRVMGAVVTFEQTRKGFRVGMIIDIVASEGVDSLRRLIRAAEDDMLARGIGLVTCQATTPMLQRALAAEGYRCPKPERLPKKFHYIYSLTGAPGLPRKPETMEDWHLTFGDSDNT